MLASPHAATARLLAALVAAGRLDVKLARVAPTVSMSNKRMFHDKVGLFTDRASDVVGFRGSLNESYLGLSPEGNIESVDVWPSWEGGRDAERVRNAVARFNRLWEGQVPGVTIAALPDEIRRELERVAEDADLEALLRDLGGGRVGPVAAKPPAVGGIELRKHQRAAVQEWEAHDHRGLLAHATGAGKTITGLYCAQVALRAGLVPVILVPSQLLLEQWAEQVRELLGARVVLAGGGHDRWNRGGALRAAVESSRPDRPYALIAVLNSATSTAFRAQLRPVAGKVFVIADEAHRLGSPEFRTILDWLDAPWRLGLSATPERANDPEGTRAVFDYFGGIIHRYSLKDALDDDVLAPYVYYPSWVGLTDDEQERWDRLTAEIRRRYAIAHTHDAKLTPRISSDTSSSSAPASPRARRARFRKRPNSSPSITGRTRTRSGWSTATARTSWRWCGKHSTRAASGHGSITGRCRATPRRRSSCSTSAAASWWQSSVSTRVSTSRPPRTRLSWPAPETPVNSSSGVAASSGARRTRPWRRYSMSWCCPTRSTRMIHHGHSSSVSWRGRCNSRPGASARVPSRGWRTNGCPWACRSQTSTTSGRLA